MAHEIIIYWGDDAQREAYEFETEQELQAFTAGVAAADGWHSFHVAEPYDTYIVQTRILGDTWENTWHDEDGEAQTFASYDSAREELEDFLRDMKEAHDHGRIATEYQSDDYRIIPLDLED